MMFKPLRKCLMAVSATALLSCDSAQITSMSGDSTNTVRRISVTEPTVGKLVACPTNESVSNTAEIGPLGGLLSVAGASISIPAGALLSAATVTVTVPSSNYVEIDVKVDGAEHFVFAQPVVITMSYARCSRNNLNLTPLTAWYFDQQTGELLEAMPSVDNKLLRTVTFTTGHLSGYILAN